jgi:DNA-binding SARP family transcriptional activator/tetratricopeptide (TPR) repeat protein
MQIAERRTPPDCAGVGLEIRLLGPSEFRGPHGEVPVPTGRLRILLASLALSAGQAVGIHTLAERLWPERPPANARAVLHTYVGRLRKLAGKDVIRTHPYGYQVAIAPDAVDVHRFRSLLDQAGRAGSTGDELTLLRAALALWRGAPFADLDSTWLHRDVAVQLTDDFLTATGRRIELELDTGSSDPVIAELRDLTTKHPERESLWLLLITALHRVGRRADALKAYEQIRLTLRDELGVEPGEPLVRLYRELLDAPEPARRPTAQPRQLPHDIARFTGRDEELTILDGLLCSPDHAPTIVSIDGPPGVGKTALAVHWAHRVADHYPDVQIYVNLRGHGPTEPITPAAAAESMLRALGVDSERIPADLEERSALLRSTLSRTEALIVLDNARDTEHVRPLLPGRRGLVIVTSRNQLRGLSVHDGARRVTLRPLSQEQSIMLLARTVGPRLVAEDPATVAAVVQLCDHLPLALAIVAERAQRAGSLAEVVAALENEQARLDTFDANEDNPHTNLRAALSWSYQALGPDASAMFRKLGLHPAGDIGVHTAAALAGVPVAAAQLALDRLVAAHLVEQRRQDRYELHDLIHLYAGETAGHDSPADRSAAYHRMLDWYLRAAAEADRTLNPRRRREFLKPYAQTGPVPLFASREEANTWFEQEFDCLRSVARWAAEHGFAAYAWRIAISMTTFFDHRIPWHDGVEFYEFAHAAAGAAGERHGEGYTLNSLGCIHLDQGSLSLARSFFLRSRAVFLKLADRFGEAMTTGNLSIVHGELGEAAPAKRYVTEAITLYESLNDPRGTALNLDNLGLAHIAAGDYPQAVECLKRSAVLLRELGELPVEAMTLQNLGRTYVHQRDWPNAVRAFRQSVALHRALGNRRWEAVVLADLGRALTEAGHQEIAGAILRTALATLTEFADPRADRIRAELAG